jgi:hypothetical protein
MTHFSQHIPVVKRRLSVRARAHSHTSSEIKEKASWGEAQLFHSQPGFKKRILITIIKLIFWDFN